MGSDHMFQEKRLRKVLPDNVVGKSGDGNVLRK
jgi:hypothetical protein